MKLVTWVLCYHAIRHVDFGLRYRENLVYALTEVHSALVHRVIEGKLLEQCLCTTLADDVEEAVELKAKLHATLVPYLVADYTVATAIVERRAVVEFVEHALVAVELVDSLLAVSA